GLRFLWLTLALIAIDQFTKQWVIRVFDLYESVAVMPYVNLTYVRNFGAAFSFLSDQGGWQRWLFTILAITFSVVLVIWLRRSTAFLWRQNVVFSLILAGAVGNVIDRLTYGFVIDFIDVYVKQWNRPAFTVAGSGITIGAILMLLESFVQTPQGE